MTLRNTLAGRVHRINRLAAAKKGEKLSRFENS